MSDMNSLGTVLADMGDNVQKIRTNMLKSIERLNYEREQMIKVVNEHYSAMGQIIMDHVHEIERLQGVNHIDLDPNPNHPRYGDRA